MASPFHRVPIRRQIEIVAPLLDLASAQLEDADTGQVNIAFRRFRFVQSLRHDHIANRDKCLDFPNRFRPSSDKTPDHLFDVRAPAHGLRGDVEVTAFFSKVRSEFRRVEPDLPPRKAPLQIARPLTAPLSALKPAELDVFQVVLNGGTTQMVMDRSKSSDYEAGEILINLIKRDYVVAR